MAHRKMTASTDEQITLRMAGLEDIPELSAMAGRIFQETYTGMMPEEDLRAYIGTAFSAGQIRSEWALPVSTFIIASCGLAWAGYAKINTRRRVERPEPGKYMEIERLYVLQKFHGKRIGTVLMDACSRYAGDNGIQTIWLNVWEHNTHAIEFYRRRNFEMADWSIFMRGNDAQKALWMKKNVY